MPSILQSTLIMQGFMQRLPPGAVHIPSVRPAGAPFCRVTRCCRVEL